MLKKRSFSSSFLVKREPVAQRLLVASYCILHRVFHSMKAKTIILLLKTVISQEACYKPAHQGGGGVAVALM